MNKKIKVIELLKQMEIKENLPKQIKYKNKVFDLSCSDDGIYYYANENWSMMSWIDNFYQLYEYVEILEDEEEIDIISKLEKEKVLEENPAEFRYDLRYYYDKEKMGDKINEIIKKVNELDKKINKED